MARAATSDYIHNFRFLVTATEIGGATNFLQTSEAQGEGGNPQAGFSSVTLPSGNIETAEYREGHYVYTRKQPGIPSFDDVTMSRGVTLKDSAFYTWFTVCAQGAGEYRMDLVIRQYAREAVGATGTSGVLSGKAEGINVGSKAHRIINLYEAFPVSHRPGSDMDATDSSISVQELTVAYERFDVSGAESLTLTSPVQTDTGSINSTPG